METYDVTRFEFLLTLENNIVIQRYFNVNDYNTNTKYSVDLYECVTDMCNDISKDLKWKTLDYLDNNSNLYFNWEGENLSPDNEDDNKQEHFSLQIKMGNDVFITRQFPAYIFHPKVRYTVDIRPKIRGYLEELSNVLSLTNPTTKYMDYRLN